MLVKLHSLLVVNLLQLVPLFLQLLLVLVLQYAIRFSKGMNERRAYSFLHDRLSLLQVVIFLYHVGVNVVLVDNVPLVNVILGLFADLFLLLQEQNVVVLPAFVL